MIKVKALESFWFGRFYEIKNLKRATSTNEEKHIIKGDTFDCSEEIAKYLLNETENPVKRALVEVIEVQSEPIKETLQQETKQTKTATKNTTLKKVAKK